MQDGNEEEEDFDDYDIDEPLNDSIASEKIVEKSLKQHQDTTAQNLQRELTEKYISGQLSFTDYIKQIDTDDDDEDEEDDLDESKEDVEDSDVSDDEEWIPAGSVRYEYLKIVLLNLSDDFR